MVNIENSIYLASNYISFFRLGLPGIELTGLHDDASKVLQILPFASEVIDTFKHWTDYVPVYYVM